MKLLVRTHFKASFSKLIKQNKLKEYKVLNETEDKVISVVVELYKFNGTFERMLSKLPEEEAIRYLNKYQWFSKKIVELANSIDVQIQDFTGMDFDPGLPVSVLNLEEFSADDELVISLMLEPVILKGKKLMKTGTAMVACKL